MYQLFPKTWESGFLLIATYGGELLYLRIWRNHLVQSVHVIATIVITIELSIIPSRKGNSRLLGGGAYLATNKSVGTVGHLHM